VPTRRRFLAASALAGVAAGCAARVRAPDDAAAVLDARPPPVVDERGVRGERLGDRVEQVVLQARRERRPRQPAHDHIRLLSEAGQRSGELRSDVDAAQAGTLRAARYFSAVLRWIRTEPEPFDLPSYLDDLLDLVLRGLVT